MSLATPLVSPARPAAGACARRSEGLMPMNPLRFQRDERDLYAQLILPAGGMPCSQGVVFCNPLGQEAIRTHRMYRVLADRLGAASFAVLRFDYYGTGDSAGDDAEGEPDGWVGDIVAACELLQSRAGCRELSLFGMRLGANLALRAARLLAAPPRAVLLWDPIPDGKEYIRQLQQAHQAALSTAYGARWATEPRLRELQFQPGAPEILGFPLTKALKLGLARTDLDKELSTAGALIQRVHLWGDPGEVLRRNHPTLYPRPLGVTVDWMADEALNTPIAPVEIVRGVIEALEPKHER